MGNDISQYRHVVGSFLGKATSISPKARAKAVRSNNKNDQEEPLVNSDQDEPIIKTIPPPPLHTVILGPVIHVIYELKKQYPKIIKNLSKLHIKCAKYHRRIFIGKN